LFDMEPQIIDSTTSACKCAQGRFTPHGIAALHILLWCCMHTRHRTQICCDRLVRFLEAYRTGGSCRDINIKRIFSMLMTFPVEMIGERLPWILEYAFHKGDEKSAVAHVAPILRSLTGLIAKEISS